MYQAKMPTVSYLEMDAWSSDHVSCESEHRFIVELLNTRSYEPRGSKKYDLLSAKIRVQLKQFEGSVCSLRNKLEEERNVTAEEKERRFRLVEILESYIIQLTQKFTSRSEDERRSLMGGSGSGVLRDMGTTGWGSDDDEALTDAHTPLLPETSDQLRIHQQRLMEDQEEGLDRLSRVISRQKDIAVTIGNEVDYQNELVDDISYRVEGTNTSVQRETSHIQIVSRKDSTCGYWVVIVCLFVAIVVVGIV